MLLVARGGALFLQELAGKGTKSCGTAQYEAHHYVRRGAAPLRSRAMWRVQCRLPSPVVELLQAGQCTPLRCLQKIDTAITPAQRRQRADLPPLCPPACPPES